MNSAEIKKLAADCARRDFTQGHSLRLDWNVIENADALGAFDSNGYLIRNHTNVTLFRNAYVEAYREAEKQIS